ncbi:hypothetical protein [Paenibacillus sp. GP183]|uniref:hypothetical protein n=1 Tax=Paenibacillus sp. GP183 TaxID=1882751 RepID=UPI0011151A30|nr:hypothetical protein [Paenibacillus sp. GP183]
MPRHPGAVHFRSISQKNLFSKLEDGSRPFALGLFKGGRKLGIAFEPHWEVEVDLLLQNASEPLQVVAYNRNMDVIGLSQFSVN